MLIYYFQIFFFIFLDYFYGKKGWYPVNVWMCWGGVDGGGRVGGFELINCLPKDNPGGLFSFNSSTVCLLKLHSVCSVLLNIFIYLKPEESNSNELLLLKLYKERLFSNSLYKDPIIKINTFFVAFTLLLKQLIFGRVISNQAIMFTI